MASHPRIAMVAGEASGDLLAGLLLDGLQARWPELQAKGIGGPQMARRGFECLVAQRAAGRAWLQHGSAAPPARHAGHSQQLRERLLRERPGCVHWRGRPDFNLGLEADLRAAGIKTVHFVCPSIWAWRAERVEKIRRSADHVLCIFPFEPNCWPARHCRDLRGASAGQVSSPWCQTALAARAHWALPLMTRCWPFCRAAARPRCSTSLHPSFGCSAYPQARPATKFIVPAVRPAGAHRAAGALCRAGGAVRVVTGQSHTVLAACDATLIASGTATLEAALFKRPMVIGYHMHPLSWWLMRRKQLQPWVGCPISCAANLWCPS
jgi:lipid-A-disaccharide synthase